MRTQLRTTRDRSGRRDSGHRAHVGARGAFAGGLLFFLAGALRLAKEVPVRSLPRGYSVKEREVKVKFTAAYRRDEAGRDKGTNGRTASSGSSDQ